MDKNFGPIFGVCGPKFTKCWNHVGFLCSFQRRYPIVYIVYSLLSLEIVTKITKGIRFRPHFFREGRPHILPTHPQPTRGPGERRELSSGVCGGASAENDFKAFLTATERLPLQCLPQFYILKEDIC